MNTNNNSITVGGEPSLLFGNEFVGRPILPADLWRGLESALVAKEAEGLSPNTLRAYRAHVKIFLNGIGEQEITPGSFTQFFVAYRKNHSPASVRSVYVAVRVILDMMGRRDLTGGMKKPNVRPKPKEIYSPTQLKRLFGVLQEGTRRTPVLVRPAPRRSGEGGVSSRALAVRDYAMVHVLRYCGLRASELCSLRLSELTFNPVAIHVPDGKSRYARRTIPVGRDKPLLHYLQTARPHLVGNRLNDRVFVGQCGQTMDRNTLRMALRRWSERVGFPLSAHKFRHTFITSLVRKDIQTKIIGGVAGWSPKTMIEMLDTYAHPTNDDVQGALKRAFAGIL